MRQFFCYTEPAKRGFLHDGGPDQVDQEQMHGIKCIKEILEFFTGESAPTVVEQHQDEPREGPLFGIYTQTEKCIPGNEGKGRNFRSRNRMVISVIP